MLTTTYVVNKDWDALQALDPATYEGSTQEWIYSVDAFASIYKTIEDGNNIKIPGAVNPGNGLTPEDPNYIPKSPIPLNGEGDPVVINVINGDFNENAVAAADANYTLEFSSIYNIEARPDLNTTFVGSFVSEAENNVGFKVSAAFSPTGVSTVNFGKEAVYEYKKDEDGNFLDADDQIILDDDPEAESKKVLVNTNRTTITLKRKLSSNWGKSDFVVGGDVAVDGAALEEATANVTNTDLTVNGWVWVGSEYGSFETADDDVRYTLNLDDSTVKSSTFQVRNTGAMTAIDSGIDTGSLVLRGNASVDNTLITVGTNGTSNVYGENNRVATLTLSNGSVFLNTQIFKVGKANSTDDTNRGGAIVLEASSIGYATVTEDETVITRSGDLAVNENGSLTMDAASKVYAGVITNAGTVDITIDADGEDWINATSFTNTGDIVIGGSFDGGVKRVIYAAAGEVNKNDITIEATSTDGQDVTAATRGGKVALAAGVDYETLYVSNAIDEDDDFAKTVSSTEPKDYYVDFNAFGLAKSTMESQVENVTKTILIDGTNAAALDYAGETKARIDGLTFKKDGTNAVVDDPETEEDESIAEQDVTFALTGMDFADSADLRTLMTGITVEEGVVFSADKMYQRGADALTTINGTLLIKKYPTTVTVHHDAVPAVEDDPETPEDESQPAQDAYDEEVAGDPIGDNFMIAGGEVIVNGNLIGGGTISANATNRDTTTGLPIPATLTINAGTDNFIGTDPSTSEDPVDNLSLVIGSNATVTITGMTGTDEETGKTIVVSNDVWFQNVIMRRTIATNFVDPKLNITDAIVRVVSAFDTAKGTININFQSQLFVDGTTEIAGGTINLHVTDTDIALLNNVEKREMLYTVVHAPLNNKVILSCDGDSNNDKQIDDTEYIYTSLGGRGLFVVHEDLATNLYVNAAWTDSDTKTYQFGEEVIKGKAYYGINAFNSFVEALSVAQDSPKATTIFVTSDVTDLYSADLFYKDDNGDAILFKGDLTVVSQNIDAQGVIGDLATPYTVTLKNQAGGRMDLCLSPEGELVVEDDADTAEDESLQSHPARTITFAAADAEKKTQSVTITVTKDTDNATAGGLWLDFWGNGGTVVVNNRNEANMLGTRGTLVVEETGTLKAQNLVIRSNNTVTVNGNDEVYTGENYQINATGDLILASGVMSVNDSNVYAEMIQFNDDNAITEGSFELVSSNTNWVVGTTIGTLFYKDHPVDADGNPTYTATLTFTEDSTVTVGQGINNVVTSAPDPSTFDGHGTPIDFVFDDSTLNVGKTLNNAGTLTLLNDATAKVYGILGNNKNGEISVSGSTLTANGINNSGTIVVDEDGILNATHRDGFKNFGTLEVTKGTVLSQSSGVDRIWNYGTMTLDDATFDITKNKIQNVAGATINIDGDVQFVSGEDTTVVGTITNYSKSGTNVLESIVVMGVSNTVADVDVNILGGTVMFSDDDLTFDWAVTGVSAATETADEQIVSAKLFGGTVGATLYANKKGLTLTDSGFTVVDTPAVDDDPETADDESADAETHTVYNNTVAITVAANSDLTLDIDVESWSVTGLATEAASADVVGSTAGTLKMDWTQDLTVAGNLDNVKGKIEISVSSFLGVLEGNKLLIDQYDPNATWQWKAESDDPEGTKYYKDIITISGRNTAKTDGWFIVEDNDLYLNAAAFAKVSQSHEEDIEDGWYQRFNNSAPTVNDGAADSEAPVILVLDGTFDESVFLNDKDTTFMGNVDEDGDPMVLKFTKIVAGGYDVSALDANEGTPTSLNIKTIPQEGGDVTSTTLVTVNTGSFSNYVFGGDVVRLAADETKVNFFRTGGTDMTINGGEFVVATVGGQKVIAGGLYYYKAKGVATIDGTVNLTITGGTFKGYDVYGGNYASDKTLGKNTRIEGDVKLTLGGDATEDDTALVFGKNVNGTQGGKIFAGSYGAGNTSGNVEVVLTGDKDISVDRIWGGNSGDYRDAHGEVVSTIDGDRILTFDGFSGALTATSGIVEGFNKVVISDENVLNFAASDNFNKDVKVWEFAADASVTGSFEFDFSGDTVDMSALSAGWTLSNVTYDSATQFAFGAGIDFDYADDTKTMTLVTLS